MQPLFLPPRQVLSVGHSVLAAEDFVALLRGAGVTALADVRSSPHSRRLPQFNRGELHPLVRAHGIAYVYLGGHLGGRPGDEALYDGDEDGGQVVNYERVRATPAFREGLARVCRGAERYRVALMCGEEDPLNCHRGLMITPALTELGYPVGHLRRGGEVMPPEAFERRLLEEAGLEDAAGGGLFPPTPDEYRAALAEAYRVLGRKRGFRVKGV